MRRVQAREDVPLVGLRVDARKDDWLIEDGKSVAVISASKGAVVDFGSMGGEDALVALDPSVFLGLDEMTTVVESVAAAGPGDHAVLVRRRVLSDPPLRLWTYVTFADGALRLESVATAENEQALAVTVGEIVAWGNEPTWVEGHGFVDHKGSLAGDFIARQGLGVAYALAPEQGHVVARFGAPLAGFHESARTGERVETLPPHGASQRRIITVTQARGMLGAAVAALPRFAHQAVDSFPLPSSVPEGAYAEVERCDGSLYTRVDPHAGDLKLPHGCWRVRLGAPGSETGAWTAPDAIAHSPLPRAGMLRWAIREAAGAVPLVVPARIVVRGIAGTPDPSWGEDPSDGASIDVVYADRDGERPLPPGHYHVIVTRGFEYTAHEADIDVVDGKTVTLEATLARVVDTSGWLSADLHVHASPSPDAPAPLVDRVRSLAAAGVEVAVATDHNAITDYGDAIRELGLGRWLASIVGDEVTTRGVPLGHYNVFPLTPGAPPVAFDRVTPAQLVAASRAAPPEGRPKVVQLNHPRMGSIGYFELLRFDPRDIAGWKERSSLAETGFDALEVFNGDHYAEIPEVERVMRDWYALLDAGIRWTATGNSDSHKVTYHECGAPRNYVLVGQDDPAHLDEQRFVEAVRAGKVVVSSGPFVRLEVAGKGVGETAPAGEQEVHVTVDAPPWVDVTRVELVKRGETLREWKGPLAPGVRRLDARFTTSLAPGDWVIAIARGERPMAFLARPGAKPFGFTNPVWIR